jgi:hypothetical protein
LSSLFRFNAARAWPTLHAVSVASLVTCLLASCSTEPPVPEAAGNQETHTVVAPSRGAGAEVTSLSLVQLREKLGSLKGKVVIVDLWALW